MGDYLRLLNHGIKKQHKAQKRLFLLLQVAQMKLFEEGPSLLMKRIFVQSGSPVVVVDERIRTVSHEEDDVRRRYVHAWIFNVHDSDSFC